MSLSSLQTAANGGPRNKVLRRERVLAAFREAALYPVTLVVAPAGFGKTVAVRHYLDEVSGPAVRYDLRPSNSTLLGFIRGMGLAFSGIAPDLSKTVLSAYEGSLNSSNCTAELAQWICAHIAGYRGCVAIDDLHIAQGDSRVDDLLALVVDLTKDSVHWIIASRGAGNLPVASWLAYGELNSVIDESTLRMNPEEVASVISHHEIEATSSRIERLLAETDAWPMAIAFAMYGSTDLEEIQSASVGDRELLYEYLAEQVYRSLEQRLQDLLHVCALLPELDVRVLSYAGYPQPEADLKALQSRIGFISKTGFGRYRFHDLFRDFLNHQVELWQSFRREALYRRATDALEQAGDVLAALGLYVQIRAKDDVLRLLRRHCFDLLDCAQLEAIGSALAIFDSEAIDDEAVLLGLTGLREIEQGNYRKGEALLGAAILRADDREMGAEFAIRLGGVLFHQRHDLTAILEPLVADSALSINRRMHALSLLAGHYIFAGRADESLEACDELVGFAPQCSSPTLAARIYHRAAIVSLDAHQPPETSKTLFQSALDLSLKLGMYGTASAIYGGLLTVSRYHEDDLAYSEDTALHALETALRSGNRFSIQNALLQKMELAVWKGDISGLEQLASRFLSATGADSGSHLYFRPHQAALAAWKGDFRQAHNIVAETDFGRFYDFDRWFGYAMQAAFALGSGMTNSALHISAQARRSITVSDGSIRLARVMADLTVAFSAIVDAIADGSSARKLQIERPRASEDGRASAMLGYAQSVCDAVAGTEGTSRVADALEIVRAKGAAGIAMMVHPLVVRRLGNIEGPAQLTKAERDILVGLAKGYSSKELAAISGRSVHTVRTLSQRAISKLGCSGRQKAIAEARRRGLIGEHVIGYEGGPTEQDDMVRRMRGLA